MFLTAATSHTVTFLFLMWILVSCRYLYLSSIINKTITTQRCDLMLKQNLTAIELQNHHSFAKMVDYCSSATFHCLQKCIDIFLAKFRNINDKKASIEK